MLPILFSTWGIASSRVVRVKFDSLQNLAMEVPNISVVSYTIFSVPTFLMVFSKASSSFSIYACFFLSPLELIAFWVISFLTLIYSLWSLLTSAFISLSCDFSSAISSSSASGSSHAAAYSSCISTIASFFSLICSAKLSTVFFICRAWPRYAPLRVSYQVAGPVDLLFFPFAGAASYCPGSASSFMLNSALTNCSNYWSYL